MRTFEKKICCLLAALMMVFCLAACETEAEEERTPDFEALGISCIPVSEAMEKGKTYPYETVTEEDELAATHADVTAVLEKAVPPKGFEEEEGFVWVTLRVRMAYGDEAANESGYRYSYLMTDYYDIEGVRGSIAYDEAKQCETFTVRWNGQTYQCAVVLSKKAEDWAMDESTGLQHCAETVAWTMKIPEGYDGIVCGLADPLLKPAPPEEGEEASSEVFPAQYDPASFLLFRVDAMI